MSAFDLYVQTIQTDTKNAIQQRQPLPALVKCTLGGAITGFPQIDWADAQRLWNNALANAYDDIIAYGNALATGDYTAEANAIIADFQQSVDLMHTAYPALNFRLFLQDNTYGFYIPGTTTPIAATTDSVDASIGASPQDRAVIGLAFNNVYDNGGVYVAEYYSSTLQSFGAYVAGGVYDLNSTNAACHVNPMFVMRLAISKVPPI